ncbi:TIGR02678 family protein [Paenibacillus doosanensis]|nr:TIGR02678 family protein [Paenibacillus doosanensis]
MNALLNRPWIAKETDSQLYYWIKEQYQTLREWFWHYTGYNLIINGKLAKLEKVPEVAYSWMGFQEFREPLDYSLFTFCLWFLEARTEQEQFLLTDLIKEVRDSMTEMGMNVDWRNYYHRLSMARALKKLKNLQVIQAVDGTEADWAMDNEKYNVLYEVTSYSRYVLRHLNKELAAYTDMMQMSEAMIYEDNLEEQNRKRRHRLYRRYLLEPVVLDEQWKEDLFYFHGQKNHLINQIKLMFGWEGSRYHEGILFFEPTLSTEAEVFPTLASISDLVMLVLGQIRQEVISESIKKIPHNLDVHITRPHMERILIQLKEQYGEYWTNDQRKMKSSELAEQIFLHMIEWGFGEWEDSTLFTLWAVAGRWVAQYGTGEMDL